MSKKNIILFLSTTVLIFTLPACNWFSKPPTRETILDKIVNIPDKLVLDIPQIPPLCDELPGLKKGFADILNGKLYYEEEGQGIPLVLINGGPGGTHHCFHPYFSQLKDVARVIYYDQRGTGKSSSDDTGATYTVKQAIEDLESLRQSLKIDKWAVLGHSYGGLLAQCYALTYPQHCIGLILVASSTGISDNTMQPVKEKMFISQAEKDAIESIRRMAREGKLTSAQCIYNTYLAGDWKHWFYYKPTNFKDELARHALYGYNVAPGFEELMRIESDTKIPQSDFLKGKFDDFEIPTLILEAKWELAWWNPERIDDMRKNHPHAQLEIFEKSGHMIFVDESEKFFSLIRDFLKKANETKITYKPDNRLTWPEFKSDAKVKAFMDKVHGKDK
ncbi:MAG: alpha/beta fold hydrolase [Candidatus Babeliales bacterium]|jgi:proline iminopeptidase